MRHIGFYDMIFRQRFDTKEKKEYLCKNNILSATFVKGCATGKQTLDNR